MNQAVVFWSGGKDAAMALHRANQNPQIRVVGLVTTLNKDLNETAVHKIPEAVLDRQAKQTGLPLRKMWVKEMPGNKEYEKALSGVYSQLKKEGINTVIYGDIFLEDIKAYREDLIEKAGLKALFPLWRIDSRTLMNNFIAFGFKAIICNINSAVLPKSFLGRELNARFLSEVPPGVDPAGENGEFHTFCFDGPVFRKPVEFSTGGKHISSVTLGSPDQKINYKSGYLDIL